MEALDVQVDPAALCSWSRPGSSHLDYTPWFHVFIDWKSDLNMAVTGSDDGF